MANQENQSRMAEARQELEKTRDEMQKASEQLQDGEVSSALASGTRAQEELQQMRDEFRQRSSNESKQPLRRKASCANRKSPYAQLILPYLTSTFW